MAGCELGRAPVRYEIFAAVQKHFSINPIWLATGEESPTLEGFSDEKFRDQIKPRELFSSVFDRLINKHLTANRVKADAERFRLKAGVDFSTPAVLERVELARTAKSITLEELAKLFANHPTGKILVSAKDLEEFESGKKKCPADVAFWWIRHLAINEKWLWTGMGKMFYAEKTPSVKEKMSEVRDAIRVLTSKFRDLEETVSRTP
jgi:hypothetical protein